MYIYSSFIARFLYSDSFRHSENATWAGEIFHSSANFKTTMSESRSCSAKVESKKYSGEKFIILLINVYTNN